MKSQNWNEYNKKSCYYLISCFSFLLHFSMASVCSYGQTSIKTNFILTKIILNGDTLPAKEVVSYSKINEFNRAIIWEQGDMKISAVCIIKEKKDRRMTKIRFDRWNGHKWKKSKLLFTCDGLDCSWNRWFTWQRDIGSIDRIISNTYGLYCKRTFSQGNKKITIELIGSTKLLFE